MHQAHHLLQHLARRHRSLYLRLLRHVLPYDLLPSTTQGAAAAATSRKVYGAACAILQEAREAAPSSEAAPATFAATCRQSTCTGVAHAADCSHGTANAGASTNGKSCLFPCADFSDHHGVDASGVWCPVSAHRARACIDVADVPDSVRGKDPRQRDMKHAKGKNGEPNLE